jgi:hypothetical protein
VYCISLDLSSELNNTNVFVTTCMCNPPCPSSEPILRAKCGHTVANDIKLPTTPVPDLLGGHYIASESQAQMICDTISVALFLLHYPLLPLEGELVVPGKLLPMLLFSK